MCKRPQIIVQVHHEKSQLRQTILTYDLLSLQVCSRNSCLQLAVIDRIIHIVIYNALNKIMNILKKIFLSLYPLSPLPLTSSPLITSSSYDGPIPTLYLPPFLHTPIPSFPFPSLKQGTGY